MQDFFHSRNLGGQLFCDLRVFGAKLFWVLVSNPHQGRSDIFQRNYVTWGIKSTPPCRQFNGKPHQIITRFTYLTTCSILYENTIVLAKQDNNFHTGSKNSPCEITKSAKHGAHSGIVIFITVGAGGTGGPQTGMNIMFGSRQRHAGLVFFKICTLFTEFHIVAKIGSSNQKISTLKSNLSSI